MSASTGWAARPPSLTARSHCLLSIPASTDPALSPEIPAQTDPALPPWKSPGLFEAPVPLSSSTEACFAHDTRMAPKTSSVAQFAVFISKPRWSVAEQDVSQAQLALGSREHKEGRMGRSPLGSDPELQQQVLKENTWQAPEEEFSQVHTGVCWSASRNHKPGPTT